jgi:hypothetical protein
MGGFRAVLTVATSLAQHGHAKGSNDRMNTTSRYNRRDFLKVAAPVAIGVTQGIAPAQSRESSLTRMVSRGLRPRGTGWSGQGRLGGDSGDECNSRRQRKTPAADRMEE